MKKKTCGILLVGFLLLGTASIAAAQEKAAVMLPPKVLTVVREIVKPGSPAQRMKRPSGHLWKR